MATMNTITKVTEMNAPAKPAQIRVTRRSPAYWRVTIDNPPVNVMGPEMVKQFQGIINALEADEQVKVVVFDSAPGANRAVARRIRRCSELRT